MPSSSSAPSTSLDVGTISEETFLPPGISESTILSGLDSKLRSWIYKQLTNKLCLQEGSIGSPSSETFQTLSDVIGRAHSSNDLPCPSDTATLKTWGSRYRTIAGEVRQEVEEIELELQKRKKLLTVTEDLSSSLLSLTWGLREMPTEILSLIFQYAIHQKASPSGRWDKRCLVAPESLQDCMPELGSLLTLSQICKRWRDVVLFEPRLWCTLNTGSHFSTALAQALTERSRSLLMSIHLDMLQPITLPHRTALVNGLAVPQLRRRLHRLSLAVADPDDLCSLYLPGPEYLDHSSSSWNQEQEQKSLDHPLTCWDQLETVELKIIPKGWVAHTQRPIFLSAPKLSNIEISVDITLSSHHPVDVAPSFRDQWAQLHTLTLRGYLATTDVLEVLGQCLSLQECAITLADQFSESVAPDTELIVMPQLRQLLILACDPAAEILLYLETPKLKTLCFGTCPRNIYNPADFEDTDLEGPDTGFVCHLLRGKSEGHVQLEHLALHRLNFSHFSYLLPLVSSSLRTLEVTFIEEDNEALRGCIRNLQLPSSVPNLERLCLRIPTWEDYKLLSDPILIGMIESRGWGPTVDPASTQLRCLEVIFDKYVDTEMTIPDEKLRDLMERGFELQAKIEEPEKKQKEIVRNGFVV